MVVITPALEDWATDAMLVERTPLPMKDLAASFALREVGETTIRMTHSTHNAKRFECPSANESFATRMSHSGDGHFRARVLGN